MFGGNRATSSTLGSSEDEELLLMQLSLQYGELIFILFFALSINHQLEQQRKSHLRFYYASFHISMDRSTRERY